MSDKKLAARLAALPQEGRIKVLLHVALGWPKLCRASNRKKTSQ